MIKTNSGGVYTLCILFLYFLGIIFPLHLAALCIIVGIYAAISYKWINEQSVYLSKTIILSILLQNTFMGIGMNLFGVGGKNITLFSQVPTIFVAVPAVIIILKNLVKKEYYLFYVYVIIIIFNYIISPIKSMTIFAYNFRNFIIFYFAFLVGKETLQNKRQAVKLERFYINCVIVAGLVGVIGLVTDGRLYVLMGAAEVANVKALNTEAYIVNDLPGYFLGDFFGTYYWRLASLFLEPVNFSSFVSLAVILQSLKLRKPIDWLRWGFLLFCNLMTFGKGGLLISGICIMAICLKHILNSDLKIAKSQTRKFVKWGLLLATFGLGIFYGTVYSYNLHFYAIKITIEALIKRPWGFGVGSVGNVSNFVAPEFSLLGAETGLLNFACQLGVEGAIVFLLILAKMSSDAYKVYKVNGETKNFIFSLLPVILPVVFIFQENIFTTQVITGFMILQGYYSNALHKDYYTYSKSTRHELIYTNL